MYFSEELEKNIRFYTHLSFEEKKYFYPLLAYDIFLEKFSNIMYENYNKKKYSRLRRKFKKLYREDHFLFDFSITYMWESLLPNREQIEEIDKKTIGQCCISLLNKKTDKIVYGIKKHNFHLYSFSIPLDNEFKETVLVRLKHKILKDINSFYNWNN